MDVADLHTLLAPSARCKDLLSCAYSLTSAETDILSLLLETDESRVEDLAGALGKDKSTVYRSLQKLVSCGLVMKEKRLLAKGGYFFVYRPMAPKQIKTNLRTCVDEWHDKMLEIVDGVRGPKDLT